jgi:hypothetical protein
MTRNNNDLQWKKMYEIAKKYFFKHGNLEIPQKYVTNEGIKLGTWINTQRQYFKKGKLTSERIELLENIGMHWDALRQNGGTSFPEYFIYYILKEYYGEDKVLYRDKSLGFEVDVHIPHLKMAFEFDGEVWHKSRIDKDIEKDIKSSKKETVLYRFREPGLNNLKTSICFSLKNNSTNSNLVQLTEEIYEIFSNEFGINIKYSIENIYNEYILNYKLNTKWNTFYRYAQKYFLKYGNLEIPTTYETKDGIKLGSWISYQRKNYKKDLLSFKQINALESIGMIWNVLDFQWEKAYRYAYEYFLEYGNLDVPARYITKDGINLGKWISRQRLSYKDGLLSSEQIEQLESIGMVWNFLDFQWEKACKYAKDYFLKYGNLKVPARYMTEDGFKLGSWAYNLKTSYKKGKLTSEQIQELESIGMVW